MIDMAPPFSLRRFLRTKAVADAILIAVIIQCCPHKSNLEIHEKYLSENLNYRDLYKPLEESSIETVMLLCGAFN